VDAAILAGGRARRFGGRDKSSLHVGGVPIIDRQLAALRGLAGRIIIVTGNPAPYREKDVHAVPDLVPDAGALGGIYTALASATTDHVIVVACDLPFLTAPFLGRLAQLAGRDDDAVVPRARDGVQPLCAVYARRLMAPMRQQIATGHLKIVDFLASVRVREVGPETLEQDDPAGTLFFNVNGPADLVRADQLARRFGA
jgi:molybdopterin-guanine dinucleotide biosynthesis protein A